MGPHYARGRRDSHPVARTVWRASTTASGGFLYTRDSGHYKLHVGIRVTRPTDSDGFHHPDATSGSAPVVGEPARYRVLLVEDHADLAEATAELMRIHGLDVSIASSGGEALSVAEELNPVLVLCDLWLPDMTGLDVAQALRARPGAKDLLIGITSANMEALRDFEDQTRAIGITLFLPKPITSDMLINLVSRLHALRPLVGPTRSA